MIFLAEDIQFKLSSLLVFIFEIKLKIRLNCKTMLIAGIEAPGLEFTNLTEIYFNNR